MVVDAARQSGQPALALTGATVYVSPAEPPVVDAVVILANEAIAAVGPRASTPIPSGARRVDCAGLFISAGFQNSHVHFTEEKWVGAATQPGNQLAGRLREMLTRYGMTTVVDTGSNPTDTFAVRHRIESGEIAGPRILTAGTPFYPPNAIPYYVRDAEPPDTLALLLQPSTPDQAAGYVRQGIDAGTDIVKLFTGSWVARDKVVPMPLDVAKGAVSEAHRQGRLVFAHPSNVAGLNVALAANVDVIAHAVEDTEGLTDEHLHRMVEQRMSMVPTLKLFGGPARVNPRILDEVGDYARSGGQILFGTDVGYLTDYDPADEYQAMAEAGLTWRDILASLTTKPAERFRESARRGRVVKGFAADLVVLGSDPAMSVRAFTDVRRTIRAGRSVYP
jgi:imidazolonepropionase-like amidohydrolase